MPELCDESVARTVPSRYNPTRRDSVAGSNKDSNKDTFASPRLLMHLQISEHPQYHLQPGTVLLASPWQSTDILVQKDPDALTPSLGCGPGVSEPNQVQPGPSL
jgi:hypothetical protein